MPFAVEALGRPGEDAVQLLRSVAPPEPSERSRVLGAAWQELSVALQMANAELLLAAASSAAWVPSLVSLLYVVAAACMRLTAVLSFSEADSTMMIQLPLSVCLLCDQREERTYVIVL